jgi:hypothetical protein
MRFFCFEAKRKIWSEFSEKVHAKFSLWSKTNPIRQCL